jgi:hypothetical protein
MGIGFTFGGVYESVSTILKGLMPIVDVYIILVQVKC